MEGDAVVAGGLQLPPPESGGDSASPLSAPRSTQRSLLLQRTRSQNLHAKKQRAARVAERGDAGVADAVDEERGVSAGGEPEGSAPAAAVVVAEPKEEAHVEARDCCGVFDLAWLHAPAYRFTPLLWIDHLGAENFHLYLWVAKDVCWAGLRYWPGEVIGAAAVLWSLYLMRFAVHDRNWWEMYQCVGQLAWLFANFWWMGGELHDHHTPGCEDLTCWYPARMAQAGWIMNAGLIWMGVFFLLIKPLKLLPPPSPASLNKYLRGHGLQPHWPINRVMSNWREYEHLHVFFWLGKDCAWNHFGNYAGDGRMWFVFMVPTLLIAADFSLTSLFRKTTLNEHAHYAATNCWVLGNMAWAVGEIWGDAYHDSALDNIVKGPIPLAPAPAPGPAPPTPLYFDYTVWSGRYWSFWVLLSSYLFILALYAIWLTAQARGRIPDGNGEDSDAEEPEEDAKAQLKQ